VSARLEVSVRQNTPQRLAMSALFGEGGVVQRNRTVFVGWGRGVGKSHWRRQVWYSLVALHDFKLRTEALEPFRGVRITSLAPTLKQWKEINWGGIEEELSPAGKWGFLRGKLDRQTGHIKFPGGSVVRPFPASEYNARTARGMRTDVLDADELDDIDAGVYDGVAVPWLSEPWSLAIQLLSGTPTRGRHGLWWRSLQAGKLGERIRNGSIRREDALETESGRAILSVFEQLPDDEWPPTLPRDPAEATLAVLAGFFAFHATYRDAPETVSALAVARARATTPDATFKREWLADPDAGEGLVYPFDEKFHIRDAPPLESFREFVVGGDHGWVDPGVLLLGGVRGHGEDAELWILDERYKTETPNHIWDGWAREWKFAKFWCDPSRPDRINDYRSQGCDCGDTDNDIFAGISRVADLLFVRQRESMGSAFQPLSERVARLYVSPKCKNTIAEFGKYRRKKLPDGTFDDQPEDKWNHAMDALRYMAIGRFGRMPNLRHMTSR
jgi:hypothetical protein